MKRCVRFWSRFSVAALCAGVSAFAGEAGGVRPDRRARVAMPRAWLDANEALILAHRQTGLRYAVAPSEFRGVAGPYRIGQQVRVARLLKDVETATGTRMRFADGVAVFEPMDARKGGRRPGDARAAVQAAGQVPSCAEIAFLSEQVGHTNASVRAQALDALYRMEGDYAREMWPGRASVFEVFAGELNRDALYWAMLEAYPQASSGWLKALSVLARARDPYLGRHTWGPVFHASEGAVQASLWALGRSGDHSVRAMLDRRVRMSFTTDPTDRYLAAAALGMMNLHETLSHSRNARHEDAEVRAASAMGMGLCDGSEPVLRALTRFLKDDDARVRFMACQSLGRIGTDKSLAMLEELAADDAAGDAMRSYALDGLARSGLARAAEAAAAQAADARPLVRAKAAEVLGTLGGETALRVLPTLLDDADRWVRAAAAGGWAALGAPEAVERAGELLGQWQDDPDGRVAVAIGLGRSRSPLARRPLAEVALNPAEGARLRRYAVLGLAQLANRAGQETLLTLADFDAPHYVPYAVNHLDWVDSEATFRHLKPLLSRGNRDTQAAAAWRLSQLGYGAAVAELLEGSNVLDNHARFTHMWGPIMAQGPETVPALVAATRSRRSDIRESAALALGNRMDVRAVDRLIELTEDASAGVRSAAAQSLGLTGDPQAIPALVRLAADDANRNARNAAVRALRMRVFRDDARVKALFADLAGTEKDNGVLDPNRPSVQDQPAHSFALRRFAQALDDEDMVNITYESSLTYDSGRGRIVLWGAHGRRVDSPQTGQTWFYDSGRNTWERLAFSREWPNEACCVWGTTYDPAQRVVVSPVSGSGGGHGWGMALRGNMQYSLPWVLDTRNDQWLAMKPARHYGGLSQLAGTSDPVHGLAVWSHGRVLAYDSHANRWGMMTSGEQGPGRRLGNTGGVFHPRSGRLIVVGPTSTWAYEPAADRWTDLKSSGDLHPNGWMTVYDTANDVLLAFRNDHAVGMRVAVYHFDGNRWESLPPVWPAPHYGAFDVAYDARRNVTVFTGGNATWRSGETSVRETWTYRYKPAAGPVAEPLADRPREAVAETPSNRVVRIRWKAPVAGAPEQYRVYRGAGEPVWRAQWEQAGETAGDVLTFDEVMAGNGPLPSYYRVVPVTNGAEGTPSYPAPTALPAVRQVAAVRGAAGVRVSWAPVAGAVGYHVYRAPVPAANYWQTRFDPMSVRDALARVTAEPVSGSEWRDTDVPEPAPATEERWPDTFAYVVRPVNGWGEEGGESPVTPAWPNPPGLVRAIPWVDGLRLILWAPEFGHESEPWFVTRQDDWHLHYAFRWSYAPSLSPGLADRERAPAADRRRYRVSALDGAGTTGIPSSGVWSHGFP